MVFLISSCDNSRGLYHQAQGIKAYKKGNYFKAHRKFDKGLELKPDLFEARFYRARVLEMKGELEAAINDYNFIIDSLQIQDISTPIYNRGVLKEELKYFEEAYNDYTWALEIFPIDTDAYINRAAVSDSLGRIDQAKYDYKKVIDLREKHEYGAYFLANIYLRQHKVDSACIFWRKAIQFGYAYSSDWADLGIEDPIVLMKEHCN